MIIGNDRVARTGKIILILSFALQVILLILVNYTNAFSAGKGLTRLTNSLAYSMYLNFGNCASQFFLIRLFSYQTKKFIPYALLYILFTLLSHWEVIYAFFKGYQLGESDLASLLFGVILTVLIIITIISRFQIIAVITAVGVIGMTVYNINTLSRLNTTINHSLLFGMMLCEILFGIGLALSLLGIAGRKQKQTY